MPFDKYTLGCYLLDRLEEVGVQDMFGVPGDFNLRFLDDLMTHRIKWIGTANELNAAYAADGYARCRGIGCLLTTYGVGELSAANGVAGSYAESVPVIHIVGAPSYSLQERRLAVHHSLGDGDFHHFLRMHKEICCAAVMLTPEKAREQIDHVITEVLYHKKPGYIALPTDLAAALSEPPSMELVPRLPAYCEESLDAFEEAVSRLLNSREVSAGVLIGHLVDRYNAMEPVHKFLETTRIPYAVAALGKGAVSESFQNFLGIYIPGEEPSPAAVVLEELGLTMTFGVELTDAVTGGFKHRFSGNGIHIHPFEATVGELRFSQIPMHKAIAVLQELFQAAQKNWPEPHCPQPETFKPVNSSDSYGLNNMWNEIQNSLRPGDIILADMGTSGLSSVLLRLPEGSSYCVQCMYSSIGFSLPAALGMKIAFPHRRVLCIMGDGAAQMTIQELGTVAKHNLNIEYILVNNAGYTIERYIRGMKAEYNDIVAYDWCPLVKSLCLGGAIRTHQVRKSGELESLLKSTPPHHSDQMQFIEVFVDKFDAPLRSPMPLPLPDN